MSKKPNHPLTKVTKSLVLYQKNKQLKEKEESETKKDKMWKRVTVEPGTTSNNTQRLVKHSPLTKRRVPQRS